MNTRLLFCLLAFTCICFTAKANYYVWKSKAYNTWDSNGSWIVNGSGGGGYPQYSGDIAEFSGSGNTYTVTLNSAVTVSEIIIDDGVTLNLSLASGVTLTVNSSGTLTALLIGTASGGSGLNLSTVSGTATESISGTSMIAQNSTLTVNSSNTLTFPSNSSLIFSNGCSITNSGTIQATSTTFLCAGTSDYINNSGTITFTGGAINFSAFGTNGYLYNSGNLNLSSSCTLTLGNGSEYLQNTSTGIVTASSSTFNMSGSNAYLTTAGTFDATNCTFNFNNQNTITNSGSFTTQATCNFNMTSSSNCTIANTGTYKDHGSTYTLSGYNANISNSGSSAAFAARGATFNLTNTANITNSSGAAFTADSASAITLSGYNSYLSNSAYFNAGTSGSSCVITLSSQAANITNTGSSGQNAYFNLGPTSEIATTAVYQPYVSNTANAYSFFTLMSDATGSATIGQIQATGVSNTSSFQVFQGTFNVQRYMTGGSPASTYRTYRTLSSPTNTVSATPGKSSALNYIDFSNFGTSTTKNKYTVYSNSSTSTTYYGAFSGGSTGFSISNPNPTMYLYNETLNPSLATQNLTFVSGKNVGLTSISGTAITAAGTTNGVPFAVSSTSIPVGNGFLIFYIGSINGRTTGSSAIVPDNATITNVGYLNQQSIPVYLWYTPGGSTSGSGKLSYSSTVTTLPGVNMIGNPYSSVIDLKKVYSDNSNSSGFTTFYELVDINPGQAYVSYNANTGATSSSTYSSRYIASGQGFIVQATAAGQSIVFNEDQKVYNTSLLNSSSSPPILLNAQNPVNNSISSVPQRNDAMIQNNQQLTGLHLKLSSDNTTFDECGIYFNPQGSDNYNDNDALDFDGISPKVYMSSFTTDNIRTGINTMKDYIYGKRIKLFVKAITDGIYKLNLEDITNIDTTNYNVFLIDKKLNDSLDMAHYKTYTFNLYIADTASFTKRFLLAIEPKLTRPYNLIAFSGQKGDSNSIQLNWNTANEGNYTTFGLEKLGADGNYTAIDSVQSNGSGIYSFNDQKPIMGNNIYRLAQNDIHGNVTFSGPINVNYNTISVSGMFTIYPNPSKDMINISVNSGITGSRATPVYLASIYNLSGVVMDSKQVNTNNWTQDISGYKAGVYILELKTTGGDIVGKTKFVKTN